MGIELRRVTLFCVTFPDVQIDFGEAVVERADKVMKEFSKK